MQYRKITLTNGQTLMVGEGYQGFKIVAITQHEADDFFSESTTQSVEINLEAEGKTFYMTVAGIMDPSTGRLVPTPEEFSPLCNGVVSDPIN